MLGMPVTTRGRGARRFLRGRPEPEVGFVIGARKRDRRWLASHAAAGPTSARELAQLARPNDGESLELPRARRNGRIPGTLSLYARYRTPCSAIRSRSSIHVPKWM